MVAFSQAESRWDDVKLFLALYRKRTLAGGAAALSLDASTLSRRLVGLEETMRTRLFERTARGLRPTEAAELLLPAAEEMAAAHARFTREASSFERLAEGSVRLSVPPGLAEWFVAPALVALRAEHPQIQVELDVSMRLVDLTRREADIALRTRRPQAGDLVSVKLGERRWTPLMLPSRKTIRDWNNLPWIAWDHDAAEFGPARWLQRHVPESSVVLRTSNFSTQVAAVVAGVGAALLPPVYCRLAQLAPVRHAAVLNPSVAELPVNETWLVGHAALRQVPRVAAVWSHLTKAFARFER